MTNNKYQKPSLQTQDEALKISKGTQRPAQTKEQTKLIAQGIQKGIDLYKRQQNEKARELNKKLKKTARKKSYQLTLIIMKYKNILSIDNIGYPGCYFL